MSEPAESPIPYRVSYSERVRAVLRSIAEHAKARGRGSEVRAALERLHHILSVYPQYGEPLRDLDLVPAVMCVLPVPPFVVHYSLDESRRLVMVAQPPGLLPRTGLEE